MIKEIQMPQSFIDFMNSLKRLNEINPDTLGIKQEVNGSPTGISLTTKQLLTNSIIDAERPNVDSK